MQAERFVLRSTVKTDQDFLLTSYQLSHHILKTKKPFTFGEKVIKPALQIVTEQLLNTKKLNASFKTYLFPIPL